jgi:hypothetical protein
VTTAIKLKIPHEPSYHGVARLVLGGLAARLEVSYEQLEDVQLALASVLEDGGYVRQDQVTVELDVQEDALALLVGPLDGRRLQADLDEDTDERIALGRLLGTLVESASVETRPDGEWLRLEKRVTALRQGGSLGRA